MRLLRGLALACELGLVSCVYQLACQSGYLDTSTTSPEAFLPHAAFMVVLAALVAALERPTSQEPSIRSGLVRAGVAALLLAVANALVLAWVNYHIAIGYRSIGWCPFVTGLLTGLVAGPTAFVEVLAARAEPGVRRDLDAAFAAFLVAFVLLGAVALEFDYLQALVLRGGVTEALDELASFSRRIVDEPIATAYRIYPYGVPFALLAVARLRKLSLKTQTEVVVMGTAAILIAWSFIRLGFEYVGSGFVFFPVRRGALLLTAGVLPLAAHLADLASARFFSAREASP